MFDEVSIATVVLLMLLVLGGYVAYKSQARSDFDFADMLRDDVTFKPSSFRLAVFICLAISSWFVIFITLDKRYSEAVVADMMKVYIVVWSGVKVVEKLIDAWFGRRNPDNQLPPKASE